VKTYVTPVLELSLVKENETIPDHQSDVGIKQLNRFGFDPLIAASLATAVLDFCIDAAPENIQNEFETMTLKLLKEMVEMRHEYIIKGEE
jgi:hypothetical protein